MKPTSQNILLCSLLAVLTLVIMWPTFGRILVGDDYYQVGRSATLLQQGGVLASFVDNQSRAGSGEYGWSDFTLSSDYYRPMIDLSFALDYRLYGMWQPGFRFTNLLISIVCALSVFWLGLLLTSSRPTAFLAALLFTVNWGHAPALINQVTSRTDALVGLFSLLGVAAFIRYRQTAQLWMGVCAAAVIAAAPFTKEVGIGAPAVCVLYDLLYSRPLNRRLFKFHAVTALVIALYLAARLTMFAGIGTTSQLAVPTTLADFRNILAMPMGSLGLRFDSLIPGISLAAEFGLLAVLGLAPAIIYFRSAWKTPELLRFPSFVLASFYLMSGPVALMQPPATGRYLYAASGFATLWFADVVALVFRSNSGRIHKLIAVGACLGLMLPITSYSWSAMAPSWVYGSQADNMARRVIGDLENELSGAVPGSKVFMLAVPAACGNTPVFYSGLQAWMRLRFGGSIDPFVVAVVGYDNCDKAAKLTVERLSPDRFHLSLDPPGLGESKILLSLAETHRLKEGDSINCKYCTVTLRELTPSSRGGRPRLTGIEVALRSESLDTPGTVYILVHDGFSLRRFEY